MRLPSRLSVVLVLASCGRISLGVDDGGVGTLDGPPGGPPDGPVGLDGSSHPRGSLDTSFAGDGIVTEGLEGSGFGAVARAVAFAVIDEVPKIYVAGSLFTTMVTRSFVVARFGDDGGLDTTFGTGGFVTESFGSLESEATGLVILEGEAFATGWVKMGISKQMAAIKLDRNGVIRKKEPLASGFMEAHLEASALMANGQIAVAGTCKNDRAELCFATLRPSDLAFGRSPSMVGFGGVSSSAEDIAVGSWGIMVVGLHQWTTTCGGMAAAGYDPNGNSTFSFSTVQDGNGCEGSFPPPTPLGAAVAIMDNGESVFGTDQEFGPDALMREEQCDPPPAECGRPTFLETDALASLISPGGDELVAAGAKGDLAALTRLSIPGNPGTIDRGFGQNGTVTLSVPTFSSSRFDDATLDSQGRIVAAGSATGTSKHILVARFWP